MQLVTRCEVYNNGKKKELRKGVVDGDPTLKITRIMRTVSDNALVVYMQIRKSEEDEWSEEFLAAKYINMPYAMYHMPEEFLEEGEVF